MANAPGPIYEVTCSVDREIVEAFDSWLAQHIEEMLQIPGISGAEVYEQEDDEQGRARRVTHYYFVSDTGLEQYLSGQAEAKLKPAIDRFGDRFDATQRILRHADVVDGELKSPEFCLNCGTALGGQYCGNCGQRAASRLISVWELLKDAFGDLLELDSRLWRTLIPLISRPGKLTRDYLEGRRARFMPPFRMYLVLSIVFFLIAFFDPREELGFLFEPAAETTSAIQESENDAGEGGEAEEASRDTTVSFTDGDSTSNCDMDDIDNADFPEWLKSRLTKERLKVMCDRIIADDGRAFLKKLLDNVPAALFVLLPLMALVLKVLYPLSKRYYVEHLLFVVHYHAFVFLILTLQILFARLGSLAHVLETPIDVTIFAASVYVPVYLYKALRRVYGQGQLFTTLKFLILTFAYFAGLMIMFGLVALFAAFSI